MKKLVLTGLSIVLLITLFRCRDFFYYTKMWLTYEPKVFMGNMEPPFPSWFEVMWSLKGPDRNKNGIRDDVEIYINNNYKDLNKSELVLIYNGAVVVQGSLRYESTEEFRKNYWVDYNISRECFGDYSFSSDNYEEKIRELIRIDREVRAMTRNTILRKNVSRLFLNKFHMWGFESGGYRSLNLKLNMWKFCGLERDESDKAAVRILKKKFSTGRLFNHLLNLKQYEEKYGKGNRNLYENEFSKDMLSRLDR